ncbi:MBL fold metallo-hydrolase [Paludibacter sp.]|uniref:MBL fold metallo-hydrolase n=1 Tax=Paludibacter sp. TaxID=1898105 RepID=UPI001352EFD7|nr:MBL fold metallo-hydrolase [Paludibacter sp.]MTK54430.1 MBL fold metallo-hydrolase [Paludibacter sp.]
MKLTYVFHSCFVIESDDVTFIFDFYKDSANNWLTQHLHDFKGKVYVFASHAHHDHFNKEILGWSSVRNDIQYVFSKDILTEKQCLPSDGFFLDKGDVYQDDRIYVKAYGSTDQGISFYVEAGGKKIFHAGDLNNWHWKEESTPEEISEVETFYQNELSILAGEVPVLDVAMFPLDPRLGADFADGAILFLQQIKTGLLVPMHCQGEHVFINSFGAKVQSYGSRYFSIEKEEDNIEF